MKGPANSLPLQTPEPSSCTHRQSVASNAECNSWVQPSPERITHIRMQYEKLSRAVSERATRQRQGFVLNDPTYVNSSFACPHCCATFQYRRDLEFHFWTHTQPHTPYLCHLCGASFEEMQACAAHSIQHGQQDYICQLCGKVMSCITDIQEHWEDVHLPLPTAESFMTVGSPVTDSQFPFDQFPLSNYQAEPKYNITPSAPSTPGSLPMLPCSEVEQILSGLQSQRYTAPRSPPPSSFMFVDVTVRNSGLVEYRPKKGIELHPEYQKHFGVLPQM